MPGSRSTSASRTTTRRRDDAMWEVNVKGPLRLIASRCPRSGNPGAGASSTSRRFPRQACARAPRRHAISKSPPSPYDSARRLGSDDLVRATAICPSFVATDDRGGQRRAARRHDPARDLAGLVAIALALPNNAVVAGSSSSAGSRTCSRTICPHAHFIRCPPRGRSAPFGRPGGR